MSQIITLNTKLDGSFDNYFEDTIKIPKNSEVALIKTIGINVQYDSYEFVVVPDIAAASRSINILRFCCDGANVSLHWREIYNKYADLRGASAYDEDTFFSGAYRWTIDPSTSGNLVETICETLSDKLEFYEIRSNSEVSYIDGTGGNPITKVFGLTSTFSTKRLNDPDNELTDIDGLNVYSGTATTTSNSIETTADNTVVYSNTELAINAGMITFTLTKADPKFTVGIVTQQLSETGVTGNNLTVDFNFAIEKESDGTFFIIRDGDAQKIPAGFTSGTEDFAFLFTRTNTPEAVRETEYTCYLLQGYAPAAGGENYQNFIVARYDMKDGFLPSFVIDAPTSGAKVENIRCITASLQDKYVRQPKSSITSPIKIGSAGTVFRNGHSYVLNNSSAMPQQERKDTALFFEQLGLSSFNSDAISRGKEIFEGYANENNNRLLIETKLNAPVLYQQFYYLPQDKNKITLEGPDPGTEPILNGPHPYLQLHMETMNTITFEGNYQKKSESRRQNTATKVIMNIPRGEDNIIGGTVYPQTYATYDYEIFNPYYITLNNSEEIPMNQIKARLTTPDNTLVILDDDINTGNAVIMLHNRKELATN